MLEEQPETKPQSRASGTGIAAPAKPLDGFLKAPIGMGQLRHNLPDVRRLGCAGTKTAEDSLRTLLLSHVDEQSGIPHFLGRHMGRERLSLVYQRKQRFVSACRTSVIAV